MSPMTRDRAGPGDVPGALMVEYYRQRASAGLIVTEGVQPSAVGKGYWRTPGIWSEAQIEGWAKVADAVHAELVVDAEERDPSHLLGELVAQIGRAHV